MTNSTTARPLVLLVEDEAPMRKFLRTFLSGAGYRTNEATSGREAIEFAAERPPDLVLLDLGLPDMDGQDVLKSLREWLQVPIIILSVRNQDVQKIAALDHGADDYLTKPFSTGELLARLRVAFRHSARDAGGLDTPVFKSGDLRVDFAARQVFAREQEVHLTPKEYNLLKALIHNGGRVLTHQYLFKEVWGPREEQNTQLLRVFMASLRRKIEADPARPRYILTEQGVGYRLAVE